MKYKVVSHFKDATYPDQLAWSQDVALSSGWLYDIRKLKLEPKNELEADCFYSWHSLAASKTMPMLFITMKTADRPLGRTTTRCL